MKRNAGGRKKLGIGSVYGARLGKLGLRDPTNEKRVFENLRKKLWWLPSDYTPPKTISKLIDFASKDDVMRAERIGVDILRKSGALKFNTPACDATIIGLFEILKEKKIL